MRVIPAKFCQMLKKPPAKKALNSSAAAVAEPSEPAATTPLSQGEGERKGECVFELDPVVHRLSVTTQYNSKELQTYCADMGLPPKPGTEYDFGQFQKGLEHCFQDEFPPQLAAYCLLVMGMISNDGIAQLPNDYRIYPLISLCKQLLAICVSVREQIHSEIIAFMDGEDGMGCDFLTMQARLKHMRTTLLRLDFEQNATVRVPQVTKDLAKRIPLRHARKVVPSLNKAMNGMTGSITHNTRWKANNQEEMPITLMLLGLYAVSKYAPPRD